MNVTPMKNMAVCSQYPEFDLVSSLKNGSNSKPENLMLGIQVSGMRFMSSGLMVVWRTLTMYIFCRKPMRASTLNICSRCINMNKPGPRENTDLKDQKAFKMTEAAEPAILNEDDTFPR